MDWVRLCGNKRENRLEYPSLQVAYNSTQSQCLICVIVLAQNDIIKYEPKFYNLLTGQFSGRRSSPPWSNNRDP